MGERDRGPRGRLRESVRALIRCWQPEGSRHSRPYLQLPSRLLVPRTGRNTGGLSRFPGAAKNGAGGTNRGGGGRRGQSAAVAAMAALAAGALAVGAAHFLAPQSSLACPMLFECDTLAVRPAVLLLAQGSVQGRVFPRQSESVRRNRPKSVHFHCVLPRSRLRRGYHEQAVLRR